MSFVDLVADMDRDVQRELGGVPVTYTTALGATAQVTGIFDAQFVLAKGDAHAGVEATGPAVFLRIEDLPGDPRSDKASVSINGIAYHVMERLPDDMGGIVLALRRKT